MPNQKLTSAEIKSIVVNYIGVSNCGFLGDFTHQSHLDFYTALDLDVNPTELNGSIRKRFIQILGGANPSVQAIILEGVLDRFPAESNELRTQDRYGKILGYIERLKLVEGVCSPNPISTSKFVCLAIEEADGFIKDGKATSGVDRMHTALHAHLRYVCSDADVEFEKDARIDILFKSICKKHPAFSSSRVRSQDIDSIWRAMGTILAALNPIRNRASMSHPNEELLEAPEAMLAVNAARSALHYIDARIALHKEFNPT